MAVRQLSLFPQTEEEKLIAKRAKHAEYMRQWNAANPDKVKANAAKKYKKDAAQIKAKVAAYRIANPEKRKTWDRAYHVRHKESIREYQRAHAKVKPRQRDPLAKRAAAAKWRAANRTKLRAKRNAWVCARMKSDPAFKLSYVLRTRVRKALKAQRSRKVSSTAALVGCSVKELKSHIESKWLPGMTWKNHNYRGWHLDHIRPLAAFDLADPEQQRAAFHFTNLQPLWWADNLSKSDKYEVPA